MQVAFVGLGRMGGNMARRLIDRGQHEVFGFARDPATIEEAERNGVATADSLEGLVGLFSGGPRVVWSMVPAGAATEETVSTLASLLEPGDVVVDGGNSNWKHSQERAARLGEQGIDFVESGTSGGVWGYDVGYCQMVGGDDAAIAVVAPLLETLSPPDGWLHVGPSGAGHFTKMVHNGIEYGLMQAYAEGFEILQASEFDLDEGAIAHLWNQGSVVRSWLLELLVHAYKDDPNMHEVQGWVEDSGEGRWTLLEAIEKAVPAPVLAMSLIMRFRSRQPDTYSGKVLASLRNQFGGHSVQKAAPGRDIEKAEN